MKRIAILIISSFVLLSCSGGVSEIKAKVYKYRIKKMTTEKCKDNEKCKKEVKIQFDSCWNDDKAKRMFESDEKKRNRLNDEIINDLLDCIVDEHGKPFF